MHDAIPSETETVCCCYLIIENRAEGEKTAAQNCDEWLQTPANARLTTLTHTAGSSYCSTLKLTFVDFATPGCAI